MAGSSSRVMIPAAASLWLEEIAYPFELVDRPKGRADQDLLKARRFDLLDPPPRLLRRADKIDRGKLCQFRRFRPLLEVDRTIGEDRIGAALLAKDRHAVF